MDPKWAALGKLLNNQKRNEKKYMAAAHPVRVDGWKMLADKYEPIKQQESSSKKHLHLPSDFLTFPPCGLVLLVFVLLGSAWPEVFSRHVRQSCDAVDLQEVPTQQGEQLDIAEPM